jgi:transposase
MKTQPSLKKSPPKKAPTEGVVKEIRRATRRHFSAEDKIRIVLDGLRGEVSIAELCRKEGPKLFGPRACITPSPRSSWKPASAA